MNAAATALGQLMERNVSEVFGEQDPGQRRRAIAELYAEDGAYLTTRTARASARRPSPIGSGASSSRVLLGSYSAWLAPQR